MEENLDHLFNRVVSGQCIIRVEGQTYIVKDPRPKHKLIGQHIYEDRYAAFLRDGHKSEAEQNALLFAKRIWHPKHNKVLEELVQRRRELKIQIEQRKIQKDFVVEYMRQLDNVESDIKKLTHTKNNLIYRSAEYLAKLEEYKYYLFNLTFHFDTEERVWASMEEFNKVSEDEIKNFLNQTYLDNTFTESMIRKLARNEPWRSSWLAAVKTGNLFEGPTSFMTDLQRSLVSWSILYDNIYENPDRPSNHIIENDDLLDDWLRKEQEKNRKKREGEATGFGLSPKISNADEIGIVVHSKDEAKKVYDMNSPQSKTLIKRRSDQITKLEKVKEGHLKDVRIDLQMRRNQLEKQEAKARAKGRK